MKENKEKFLLTGLRLLYILKLLSKGSFSKAEVLNYIKQETKIENYSTETLKLDINSLIKSGFEIERKGIRKNFKYELTKKPDFLKFSEEETEIFSFLKNAALEILDYKEILLVKNFFYENRNIFYENGELLDFEGFNFVNEKIIEKIDDLIQKKLPAKIIYSTSIEGRKEFVGRMEKITVRNNKLYLSLYDDFIKNKITLRMDKIKNVEEISYKFNHQAVENKACRYLITKAFFENNPILKTEKVIKINENNVEIENFEENEFFIVQRLLMLGVNCIKIYDNKIKEKILNILNDTLGVYEKCQNQ